MSNIFQEFQDYFNNSSKGRTEFQFLSAFDEAQIQVVVISIQKQRLQPILQLIQSQCNFLINKIERKKTIILTRAKNFGQKHCKQKQTKRI